MNTVWLFLENLGDQVDAALDRFTSYRLVLYLLLIYLFAAVGLSLGGQAPFGAGHIIISAAWLLIICRLSNLLLARLFKVPHNHESDLTTALILTFILSPAIS